MADPLGFLPWDRCSFNHRFDDSEARFRSLYFAELPETALREVLADLRPNRAAQARHIERFGPEAAEDFVATPVTAAWRTQHVLVPASLSLDGALVDLTDVATRHGIEDEHASLLAEHDLSHLDLHEITTTRRAVTQTIASSLFDQGAAGVRFPSRLDGNACVVGFEGRVEIAPAGAPVSLTDPPPEPLQNVCAAWRLAIEPSAAVIPAEAER